MDDCLRGCVPKGKLGCERPGIRRYPQACGISALVWDDAPARACRLRPALPGPCQAVHMAGMLRGVSSTRLGCWGAALACWCTSALCGCVGAWERSKQLPSYFSAECKAEPALVMNSTSLPYMRHFHDQEGRAAGRGVWACGRGPLPRSVAGRAGGGAHGLPHFYASHR